MNRFALIPLIALLGGCSNLQGLKLLAPETFGLTPLAPGIYVESEADESARAEQAIGATYAGVKSRPIVNACVTQTCYSAYRADADHSTTKSRTRNQQ